jgi:hypothetical protein
MSYAHLIVARKVQRDVSKGVSLKMGSGHSIGAFNIAFSAAGFGSEGHIGRYVGGRRVSRGAIRR